MEVNKCSICGKKGLKSFAVCPNCLQKAAVSPEKIQKLKQINNVLCITADTDGNIKECIQSLAEILEDLKGRAHGKEEKKNNTIQTRSEYNLQ